MVYGISMAQITVTLMIILTVLLLSSVNIQTCMQKVTIIRILNKITR